MVKERPFLLLAGEVHNSNSSSAEYMEQVWDKAEALGMNSLLVPITWELTEPEESAFDFALTDALITQARKRSMKLGLLWFGAWKNAQCYYAPGWVKKDLKRFKRAEMVKGQPRTNLADFHGMTYSSLSYLCEETKKADKKAFCALMRHLKETDEQDNTVVVVQVENETGVMGAARENSDEADALFASESPRDFVAHLKAHTDTLSADVREAVLNGSAGGSWAEAFGPAAEEIFSAYYIAGYVNELAEAGKAIYPLPMTVNCWLDNKGKPGAYPSGGPVARMMEVWKHRAPAIDIIAPDIYLRDFCGVCDEYVKLGNPLFIPETAIHSSAGPRLVYTVGHYHGLCFAPFGFEEMGEPFTMAAAYLFGADVTDPALKTPQDTAEYKWFTQQLNEMTPLLAAKYGTPELQAVICERKENYTMQFGDFGFRAIFEHPMISRKDGVCLVVQIAEDEFYVMANGCGVYAFSARPEAPHLDFILLEEGRFENGLWHRGRRLNGDELVTLRCEEPCLLRIKLFAYQ
jgi:beta-galactosidase GanA